MRNVMLDYHIYVVFGVIIALDIIVGLVKAFSTEGFNSTKMREGLYHKFTYIAALALAALIEYGSIYLDFGFTLTVLQPAVIVYVVLTECGSILENLTVINPELADNAFMNIFSNGKDTGHE